MNDRELMRLHARALFTHDARGRLCRVNEPNGATAPRFFLGRTVTGNEWRFRDDVADDVVEELEALCRREPPGLVTNPLQVDATPYTAVLERHAPVRAMWTGPSYRFPPLFRGSTDTILVTDRNVDVLRLHFAAWLDEVACRQPFVAYIDNNMAVSVCCSVRITSAAHEAGVETAAEFRGRGYGARVVTAWAREVSKLGSVPLYSTSWQNAASRHLAATLGLIQYGSVLHIT
jgi:hypothetical protein